MSSKRIVFGNAWNEWAEDHDLTDTETKNLVRCCDCFVSPHGSEGSGRFLAEARLLGKLTIATAYSGNLDFMNPDFNTWAGWAPPNVPKANSDWPRRGATA